MWPSTPLLGRRYRRAPLSTPGELPDRDPRVPRHAASGSYFALLVAAVLHWLALPALATDPPHQDGDDHCASCHLVHHAQGAPLFNTPGGNVNLCLSCHVPGGSASGQSLVNSDQAVPNPGLPAGVRPAGTSHRWDSGVAGRVVFLGGGAIASSGGVQSGGAFQGPFPKTYTLTITASGGAGVARFDWIATTPGAGNGAGLLTGTNVPLNEGITVTLHGGNKRLFSSWRPMAHFCPP